MSKDSEDEDLICSGAFGSSEGLICSGAFGSSEGTGHVSLEPIATPVVQFTDTPPANERSVQVSSSDSPSTLSQSSRNEGPGIEKYLVPHQCPTCLSYFLVIKLNHMQMPVQKTGQPRTQALASGKERPWSELVTRPLQN